jgi:hypothetical protein
MRRALVVGAIALAGWAGACTKVGGDPNAVVAISFDELPFPAVVVGDTLRDEAGVPVLLSAVAFNSEGEIIPDAQITFLSLDTAGFVSPEGYVISKPGTTVSMRLVAEASGLQSRALGLIITPEPDSMARDGTVDTLRYTSPDVPENKSQSIGIKLFNTSVDPPVTARGWIVRYSVEYHGVPVATATSNFLWLVDESNRRSSEDTASTEGQVGRQLRVVSDSLTGSSGEADSVVVIATATHRGVPLAGSPVRVVVQIRPRF